MDALLTTFVAYYQAMPDPYADNCGALLTAFSTTGGEAPATLLAASEQECYPLAFLISTTTHNLFIVIAPWAKHSLPGLGGAAEQYAFMGDVHEGILPDMVVWEGEHFHQVNNTTMVAMDQMAALWATRAADELLLPLPLVGMATDVVNIHQACLSLTSTCHHSWRPKSRKSSHGGPFGPQ